MYDSIPTILSSEELLDKALGRASKIHKEDKEYFYRVKKTTIAKMESSTTVLVDTLQAWVKTFPNLDRVSTYERELLEVILGVRSLQRALSRIEGGAETIQRLGYAALGDARRARVPQDLFQAHRRIVGRASSVVKDLDGPLKFLAHARAVLQAIPDVTPEDPTIVLAGYPNVGKSSLLARLTKARPDIAPYPFTTKQINVGHFAWPERAGSRARRYQMVDTPGLLEKPPAERNKIEKQAALAIAFLADVLLFVVDPSESSGYTLAQQMALLESVRKEFAGVPLVLVNTKSDVRKGGPGALDVSAQSGEGLGDLKRLIVESIPQDPYHGLLPAESPG